jgi:hypothetical protein
MAALGDEALGGAGFRRLVRTSARISATKHSPRPFYRIRDRRRAQPLEPVRKISGSRWTHADRKSKVQHAARLAAEQLGPMNFQLRRAKSPVQMIEQ